MLAKVMGCALQGLEGALVEVEVDISPGLPSFTIVGLPDTAVQEARERVRSAVKNSGFVFPMKRITVNLAPADIKKEGPAYDLPIAAGIILSSEQVNPVREEVLFLGELSLDGSLRHTSGILPMAAFGAEMGLKQVVVPACDAREAGLVTGIQVVPIASLKELVAFLGGEFKPEMPVNPISETRARPSGFVDLVHIKGQEHVKRALEVAAAGGHNMIMCGPPGSGKTMLARALPDILPTLETAQAIEVTKIYSVCGLLPADTPLIRQRPFRAPHHTISNAGLVGGGQWPHPGEVSLSHRGVLFLDELPEFGHALLEILRQPLEDKTVTISRARGSITFPANFMLVGAMNPCPCGFFNHPFKACSCPPAAVNRYQKRISGPFLDRVDIFVDVPHIEYEKLSDNRLGETSEVVRARVSAARQVQTSRFAGTSLACNSDMSPVEIRQHCIIDSDAQGLLKAAMQQFHLSARVFHRILKLARTIADLEASPNIRAQHIAEAIQYRPRSNF